MPQISNLNRKGILSRYLFPKTIYGRLFLIIVLPVLMVQIFSLYVFYNRHWKQSTQSLSYAIISNIDVIVQSYKIDPKYAHDLANTLGMDVLYEMTPMRDVRPYVDKTGEVFYNQYKNKTLPYKKMSVRFIPPNIAQVQVGDAVEKFTFTFHEYRLYTTVTAKLVWLWTIFIGVIFVIMALFFARNQARPIKKLSQGVIAFSKGDKNALNVVAIRGSDEVRKAIFNLRTMADRINRHQQQRTDMLSGISHDLRTPLTRMKLQLALMEQSDDTRVIIDNINDLEQMIESYLAFTNEQQTHVWKPIDINILVTDIYKKWQAVGNDITLTLSDSAIIQGDMGHITRMVENIISNGFRYGTKVDIVVRKLSKTVCIDICDNGCGIPQDKLDKVFRPFVRLEESRNISTGGVGLGLSIALDIATKHGGNITLTNHPDTSGLIATIILPLWQK